MKPNNFRHFPFIEMSVYGISNLCLKSFKGFTFSENRFPKSASYVSAFGSFLCKKYQFFHFQFPFYPWLSAW